MAEVAVIGGGGFIGRHLVARLVAEGRSVRIISRSAEPARREEMVEYVRAGVGDPEAIGKALAGVQEVYHLATGGGAAWSDFERDFIHGTRHVAEACRREGVRRMVYASTIAALYLGGTTPVTEADGVDSKPEVRGFYARAKAAAESVLLDLHKREGFPVVIVRPGVVMGRGGSLIHSGAGMWMSDLCCVGWGHGNTPIPFVLAGDVANAMIAAMRAPGVEGKALNLAGDVRPTAREFVHYMALSSRRRIRFYPRSLAWLQFLEILKWSMKVAARKAENAFPSYRDLKSRSLRAPLDCAAAKQLLDWHPVAGLDEFLAEAVDSCIPPSPPGDLRSATPPPGL